ncbi:MAG: hypothetical protein Q4P36_00990 [Bowdeniella nasicola]|nr:hypothetical protein [Bowdeniella nasicola]
MNIIDAPPQGNTSGPNAVGTPNATEAVRHHIRPGRKRAHLLRYFRFDLPRLTKAILVALVSGIGIAAGVIAFTRPPFPYAALALGVVVVLSLSYVLLALFTRWRIWDFGSAISAVALLCYLGGTLGTPPLVPNGATIGLAATWNLLLFLPLAYLVANWAVNFGILVVWPDRQGFTD